MKITKYITIFAALLMICCGTCLGEEKGSNEPTQAFFRGNTFYEERDYAKALQNYEQVLKLGVESGNLYYNIGNTYLKMGKVGYAILYYSKARRLIPQDSDLKSNLSYARSLVQEGSADMPRGNFVGRIIRRPFASFNLNNVALIGLVLYACLILMAAAFIINPVLFKKIKIVFIALCVLLVWDVTVFGLRYYYEEALKHGVVIQKEVEGKYEPIDKSTTYYKLREGSDVIIMKTKNDWRQIRRRDGKRAWVKKESVEEV